MPKRLGSKKVAVSALIALGAIGGSVAYAYPPGTCMSTTATAAVTGYGGANVTVTVYNANPKCQINIKVQGANEVVVPAERGDSPEATTITRTVTTTASTGQKKVNVTATNCVAKEKAQSVVDIIDARLETNSRVYYQGDLITVRAFGFTPNSTITFRLAPNSGAVSDAEIVAVDQTNKQGSARGRLSIPGNATTGDWALVASTGSSTGMKILEIEHPSR